MTDVPESEGLRLGFTAGQWIAPGDQVSLDVGTGAVTVTGARSPDTGHRTGTVDELVRVLTLARAGLDEHLAAAAGPDQARLGTAAAGLTLVLAWLTPTATPAVIQDETEAEASGPSAPAEEPSAALPPGAAPDDPTVTGRPRKMPLKDEPSPCQVCGKPVPGVDAQFSWARHRKVLCREPDGGCFKLERAPAKKSAKDEPVKESA